MHFNLRILLLLLLLPLTSYTKEQTPIAVEFAIKPVTCIVKQTGDACTMTVKVHWQASTAVNACLFQDSQQQFCWQQQQQAQQKITVQLKDNTVFSLKNEHGQVLAEQLVSINASLSTKYRRRLRADWSLF